MGRDLFEHLPSEIISNNLSRLDIRSIAFSKCVSKPWLDFLSTDEFVKFHISSSATSLAVLTRHEMSGLYTLFELEDESDAESSHDRHVKHLAKFNFPHCKILFRGSANGMLLLLNYARNADALYVCNPISREYIELPFLEKLFIQIKAVYGFGASKISGHHKVIQIRDDNSDCYVYTLGTGSWRRVEPPNASFCFDYCYSNAFVNGNVHWLVTDSKNKDWICYFDLEMECFSAFSVPSLQGYVELSVLRDCVCLCDAPKDEIVIWLMKEYGDEKSWTKEYVIKVNDYYGECETVRPIKVFKDVDILMVVDEDLLLYYSNKKKTTQEIGGFYELENLISIMVLTPSFLSLKSLGMEDVISF